VVIERGLAREDRLATYANELARHRVYHLEFFEALPSLNAAHLFIVGELKLLLPVCNSTMGEIVLILFPAAAAVLTIRIHIVPVIGPMLPMDMHGPVALALEDFTAILAIIVDNLEVFELNVVGKG
jgi:hypothetical protein